MRALFLRKKLLVFSGGFLALFFLLALWPEKSSEPAILVLPESESSLSSQPSQSAEEAIPEEATPLLEESAPDLPYTVSFVPQAPMAEWHLDVFQNACEEASVLMAMHWIDGNALVSRETARAEILAMSSWEAKRIGHSIDTDAAETKELLLEEYGAVKDTELVYDFSLDELKDALAEGVVLVPANGRALGNPNFKQPGPLQHMLVIIGYDREQKEFITNDPGTRLGAGYRYDENILYKAIRDYPTGKHLPIRVERKAMIIVSHP